jgi:hypothetical protein
MAGFAYFDQYGIFHVVDDEATAKQYARNGKYVATDVPHEYGYPTIAWHDGSAKQVVVYDRGGRYEGYVDGNEKNGVELTQEAIAFLQPVFEQLK